MLYLFAKVNNYKTIQEIAEVLNEVLTVDKTEKIR